MERGGAETRGVRKRTIASAFGVLWLRPTVALGSSVFICGQAFVSPQKLCTICTRTHIAPQIGFDPQNHRRRTSRKNPKNPRICHFSFVSPNAPSPVRVHPRAFAAQCFRAPL